MKFRQLHKRIWLGFYSHSITIHTHTKKLGCHLISQTFFLGSIPPKFQLSPNHYKKCFKRWFSRISSLRYKSLRAGHCLSLKQYFKQQNQTFLTRFPENSDLTEIWLSFLPPWWSSKTFRFISLIEDKVATYQIFLL